MIKYYGLDEAIIGTVQMWGKPKVVAYDKEKIIKILMRDMSLEDALEHFDFNIASAYVGKETPVFVTREDEECTPQNSESL